MTTLLKASTVASFASLFMPPYGSPPPKGGTMSRFTHGIGTLVLALSLGWSPHVQADAVTAVE